MLRSLVFVGIIGVTTLCGCSCIILENTDPYGDPVVVEFNIDPIDQPNPGQLDAGLVAEITFPQGTTSVDVHGYDPFLPEFEDDITVDLPLLGCRHLEWDGFQFIDRGISIGGIARVMSGDATFHMGAPDTSSTPKGNPEKAGKTK